MIIHLFYTKSVGFFPPYTNQNDLEEGIKAMERKPGQDPRADPSTNDHCYSASSRALIQKGHRHI